MVLRIRLARFGTKRKPIYNIVLTQAKTARNSKPMEVLGVYNPIAQVPLADPDTPEFNPDGSKYAPKKFKDIKLDSVRTKYWLGVGAQPTEPVEKLLCLVSAFPDAARQNKGPLNDYDCEYCADLWGLQIGLLEKKPSRFPNASTAQPSTSSSTS
jgi:small subunit ribosomal protein S16